MTIFEKYIEIQGKINELEKEKKATAMICLNTMKQRGEEQIKNDAGIFSIMRRRFWSYSDKVKELEDNVKEAKKAEEKLDIASCKVIEMLRFLPKKEEEIIINQ